MTLHPHATDATDTTDATPRMASALISDWPAVLTEDYAFERAP